MNIRAAEAGLVVHEVPSFEHKRVYGVSNLHIVMDGLRIGKVIVREWRSHRRAERRAPTAFVVPKPAYVSVPAQAMAVAASQAESCAELT
jgi:hypothetical protein